MILILRSPAEVLGGTLSTTDDNKEPEDIKDGESSVLDIDDVIGDINPAKSIGEEKPSGDKLPSDTDKSKIKSEDKTKDEDDDSLPPTKEQLEDKKSISDKKIDSKVEEENKKVPKRDYSAFDPEDAKILEKQPNGVFNLLAPALKKYYAERDRAKALETEVKTLKEQPGRIPDAWYENENAFTLTPEYGKLTETYNRLNIEANHWEQQLINIKAGKPWHDLTFDPKVGYGLAAPQEPKEGDEFAVQKAYNNALRLQEKVSSQAEKIQNDFKSQYKNLNNYYEPAIQKHFGGLMPELQPKKEHEDLFMQVVHPAHRNSSFTKLASKLFSLLLNQGQMIKGYMDKASLSEKIKADEQKAGLKTKGHKQSGIIAGNGDGEVDFEAIQSELKD